MKYLLKYIFGIFLLLSLVGFGPIHLQYVQNIFQNTYSSKLSWIETTSKIICAKAHNLNPAVLKVGLTAYLKAREQGLDNKEILTLVDYTKASTERRLWVIDLKHAKVLFNTWVAHGKNSGNINSTAFSNRPGSLKSSIGVFLTDETYMGGKGYSLRIKGLEKEINNNAFKRNIVFHGAWYVGEDIAKSNGRLGRSFGCLAVSPQVAKPLINTIKEQTLVVAYYPDKIWLQKSIFV